MCFPVSPTKSMSLSLPPCSLPFLFISPTCDLPFQIPSSLTCPSCFPPSLPPLLSSLPSSLSLSYSLSLSDHQCRQKCTIKSQDSPRIAALTLAISSRKKGARSHNKQRAGPHHQPCPGNSKMTVYLTQAEERMPSRTPRHLHITRRTGITP